MTKIKIYCWDNNPGDHDWHVGYAMAEDGTVCASHVSSSHGWCQHDICEMHRPEYVQKYGDDGFELIWLEDPISDAGWLAAAELNKKMGEAAAAKEA